jgi:TetR/AcrR family transcriptional regulator, transcriptional repressor for nem operon
MRRIHNKEDIIKIGLEIMVSKGFNATGVEAILKQAKIPKGSFYNFFSSKEAFCLEIIDVYLEGVSAVFQPIFTNNAIPPLMRIQKSFEARIALFKSYNCTKGCLLGNLGLEMSDDYESVRQRLMQGIFEWEKQIAALLRQAQEDNTLPTSLDITVLAENLIASFQGALLCAKIKKSIEPVNNFIDLYFKLFLHIK